MRCEGGREGEGGRRKRFALSRGSNEARPERFGSRAGPPACRVRAQSVITRAFRCGEESWARAVRRVPARARWVESLPRLEWNPLMSVCPPGSGSWRRRKAGAHRGYPPRRESKNYSIGSGALQLEASYLDSRRDRPRTGLQEFGFRAALSAHVVWAWSTTGRTLLNAVPAIYQIGSSGEMGFVRCHLSGDTARQRRSATGDTISVHFS